MDERNHEKYGLSTFALKNIAIVTMLIDHIAIAFFRNFPEIYIAMRIVGRLSFPLFCFVLTEGFFHTKNRKSYALRLLIFALISEIPYNKFGGNYLDLSRQNVMFTLLIGFLAIWTIDAIENNRVKYPKAIKRKIRVDILNIILEIIVVVICLLVAGFMRTSYSYSGVLLILCFYESYESRFRQAMSNVIFNMGMYNFSAQWFGIFSAIPIALYNGKSGRKKGKYLFYLFYPVHLLILVALKYII